MRRRSVAAIFLFLVAAPLWAATGGSISGTVSDPSGAVSFHEGHRQTGALSGLSDQAPFREAGFLP
jgi:hypothetical protein